MKAYLLLFLLISSFSFISAVTFDNLAYYPLNESTGTSVRDVANGYNGTNNAVLINQSGKIGTSYYFNGTAINHIDLPTSAKITGSTSRTFTAWVNLTSTAGENFIIGMGNDSTQQSYQFLVFGGNLKIIAYGGDYASSITVPTNTWTFIYTKYNGTYVTLGKKNATGTYEEYFAATLNTGSTKNATIGVNSYIDTGVPTGFIDEVGIWSRALSSSDITDLYNSGSGLPYTPGSSTPVTLNSPSNATVISDTGTYFNITARGINSVNVTNITYFIWNQSTGAIHNQTTVTGLNSNNLDYSLFIDEFIANNYTWNAKRCLTNGTCAFASSNFSFQVVPFSVITTGYSTPIIEGTSNIFTINVSFLSGYRLSNINLVYNGTSYPATFTEYASQYYYANRTITAPLVSSDANVSFYWNITLESGLSDVSTSTNQTVLNIAVDNCTTYTNQLFNFTMVDEDTQVKITNSTALNISTTIKIDMQFKNAVTGSTVINYSSIYNNTNPARVCSGASIGNSTFQVDGQIQYYSTGRFIEFYNIQNYTLNTSTTNQNITLYDLNSTSTGLEFKITFKDTNFNNRPGALIQIKRKYLDEGLFKVVELPKIGSSGYALAHLIPGDEVYSLVVVENGTVLHTEDNILAYCPNPTFTDCIINIQSYGSAITPGSFDTQGDFSSTLTYNKTSRVVTATFTIPSGTTSTVILNATKADAIGTTLVCNDTLSASGGTLTCTIPPSIGNTTIKVYLTADGIVKKWFVLSLNDTPADRFGANVAFLGLVMVLFFIGIGVQHDPKIMAITLVLGIIVMSAINIISSPTWIGTGATILWFIIAIAMILIKSENNR